jgi:AAA family ATP:ADP antiporter
MRYARPGALHEGAEQSIARDKTVPEVRPNPIAIALNVEPGEGGRLALLFTQSFFVGIVLVSFYTASSALFLSTYGSGKIPHMYVAAAVISTIIGSVYTWFQKSRGTSASVFATSLFLLVIVISFRFSLGRQANDIASFGLLAWYPVIYALLAVILWHSAGRLFDVRQGKRLFGLIGAGELLASVLGGLSTPFFVSRYGAENLLFISIIGLLFNLALTAFTIRIYRDRMVEDVVGSVDADDTDRLRDAIKSRYVVLLFVLYLLMVAVTHLVDFTFYDQARIRYKDQNALANYFGLFFAVTHGAALTMGALVSGRFISRFGIKIGMRVRPITILICAVFMAGLWFSGGTIASFFLLSTATKFFDLVLVRSFSGPSFLVLYQPLRPR